MIPFKIVIDDKFANINIDQTLNPIDKKWVLSFINDFEDGKWRYDKFQNFVWDNIAETALSFRERENLVRNPHSLLSESAKKLRLTDKDNDPGKGSELAEIVLYGIMKHHFGALPVVPKIYYKQNSNDYAKGADSVHIVLDGSNEFSVWFGEAKFYNDIEDARLGVIIKSVENSLSTEKLKKENSIITDISDINYLVINDLLRNNIKKLLSAQESIDNIKPKLHIAILLLHECEITKRNNSLTIQYEKEIVEYHKRRAHSYFKKQLKCFGTSLYKYSEISFHIILFPVPVKKDIVDKFVSIAEFSRNQ